jgi:hypothetical protein
MRPRSRIRLPAGLSSRRLPTRSRLLPASLSMGIARYGEPAGRLRMGKTLNPRRVNREQVVNACSRMCREVQIPTGTVVDASRASDPAERTRHVSPAGIRASAASFRTRQLVVATLPITLEGGADTRRRSSHSRRFPARTCRILQPAGRITRMCLLSPADPIVGMTHTIHTLMTRVIPALRHMTGAASQGGQCVVEATPISPPDMISGIHVHHGSRRRALQVRPTITDVNRVWPISVTCGGYRQAAARLAPMERTIGAVVAHAARSTAVGVFRASRASPDIRTLSIPRCQGPRHRGRHQWLTRHLTSITIGIPSPLPPAQIIRTGWMRYPGRARPVQPSPRIPLK